MLNAHMVLPDSELPPLAASELTPLATSVLIVVPAFGAAELTDAVLGDLLADAPAVLPHSRVVVLDNLGDYQLPVHFAADPRVTVHREGENLRWIGSANWALDRSLEDRDDVCIVLNNDTRLSPNFAYWLALSVVECDGVAIAAPCYDDFWLHQRVRGPVVDPMRYEPVRAYRQVPFCDGTAVAFSVAVVDKIGGLDQVAFPRNGYGADVDFALRARDHGYRCVVTEAAYLSHLRRGTMNRLPEETSEVARAEILTGLDAKWGGSWRSRAGLSPDAFPPRNSGSAASWYL